MIIQLLILCISPKNAGGKDSLYYLLLWLNDLWKQYTEISLKNGALKDDIRQVVTQENADVPLSSLGKSFGTLETL